MLVPELADENRFTLDRLKRVNFEPKSKSLMGSG